MQKSGVMLFKRTASYFVGAALLAFGVIGLGIEIELAQASSSRFDFYVLDSMCIAWGTLICIATLLRYGGGLWFAFGVILVGMAIYATIGLFRVYLLGEHLVSPTTSYSRTGVVWVIGVFCLVMGHIAHRKTRRSQPNTALGPTATAP
jgi:hypothetical protein